MVSSPRGKPEIVGSNLDTLVSIGLEEKFPQDYSLAQQVCLAIANISDRRKVCRVATSKLRSQGAGRGWGRGPSFYPPPHTHTLSFCSQQPSLGKRHPPFRLPQEHRLFERLQEMVTKGELSRRALGRTESFVCGGQLLSFPVQALSTQTHSGSPSKRWL